MSNTVYFPKTKLYPNERQWDLDDIWALSATMEVAPIDVKCLWERYKGEWCWQWEGEEVNHDFFLNHMERVTEADLNYPIILSEEGLIFDGVHRLVKARFLGLETIYAVKFDKDPAPKGGK